MIVSYLRSILCAVIVVLGLTAVQAPSSILASDVPGAPDPDDPTSLCGSFTGGSQRIPAYCQEYVDRQGSGDAVTDNNSFLTGRNSILYRIIQIVTLVTGALSVIMIIVGGFKYVVSAGDSNATKSAKDTILYAVIGLLIALFAQIIISFVLSSL